MKTQFNELEAKLQKLYDDRDFNDSRAIFDIGVQFGSLIQLQNIKEYEYKFWKKFDEEKNKEQLIRDAVDSIDDFLLRLVRSSIKDYISKNCDWSIEKGNWSSRFDSFDLGTRRKYCVQIIRVNMTQYGGDFECDFKVVGRLANLFKKHNIYERFQVRIYNDNGEESMRIYDISDVDSAVSRLNCFVRNSNNWELEQYRNFLHNISKEFLFN